jgi:O-antigen/teichoic acid export membrane protein
VRGDASGVPNMASSAANRRSLRRAAATSASTLVARAAGFGSFAVLVPVTLPYLGATRYGIWMTLLSIGALLGVTNLGLGNALITLLARTDAVRDEAEASHLVATTVAMLGAIAAVLAAAAVATVAIVPWGVVFNVTSPAVSREGRNAAAALLVIFILSTPVAAVAQVRLGYQEGYVTGWFDAAASVVGAAAVIAEVALHLRLPVLVATAAAAPLATGVLNWVFLVRRRPHLRFRPGLVDRAHVKMLFRAGGLYFVLQVAVVVGYSSDNFVAAQVLGPAAVTDYAVPSRVALTGLVLVSVAVAPLWPAYANAFARGDAAWALQIVRRSLALSAAAALAGGSIIVAFGQFVIGAWTRAEVVPSYGLLLGLAAWLVLGSVGTTLSMFLNAAHVVRPQVLCAISMAGSNIVLSVVLANKIGVAGLIWGTVISYTICVVVPYTVIIPRVWASIRASAAPAAVA